MDIFGRKLPMDEINKSPIGPLPAYHSLTVY